MMKLMQQKMSRKVAFLGFILWLGLAASSGVLAQQYAYPQTEEASPSNSYTPVGAATNVLAVDEGATPDDSDYTTTTTLNDAIEFNLTDTITDPNVDTGHIVRARVWSDKPSTPISLALHQGGSQIATASLTTDIVKETWSTVSFTLTTGQAAAITNYNDLRIRITLTVRNKVLNVSWLELEVPETVVLTAPTVTVQAATAIGTRGATLHGNVTVNGSAANNNTYFKYGTSSGVYTVTTASAGTVTTGPFSLGVTGLEPSTTYYYIACATANESGGLEGCSSPSEATFTTDPLVAPTVTVQAATAIGTNGATLHGTITVNGTAIDNNTYFKYGTSTGVYTFTTISAGTVTTGPFNLAVTGLDPSTTYYYIACATANESGGLEGCSSGEESFTTNTPLTAPTVTVQPATAIGTNGATLHGNVTVNGSAANNDTYFKYGTSSGNYTVTTGSASTVATGAFNLAVTSLNPNTTYYYIACATAIESGGLEGCSSGEQSFTTDKLAPTVTVQAATSIGSRTATLNGTVTVNGSAANNDTYFKYGTSSGAYTVTTGSAGTFTTGVFSLGMTGLEPSTTYYYIACATANETGGLEGCSSPSEATFTTDPLTAPTVAVQAATSIGANGATLNGNVTINGSATDNNTYFKYGTSAGVYTVTTTSAGTVATGTFSLAVTGLDPETTYYYIACATAVETGGLEGCSSGEQIFTTTADLTAPTVTVQTATAIGTNGATLHGTVTVNGSAADNNTYFKYGTSSGDYTVTTASAGTVATGVFNLAVTGLNPNTTYYYIACATANEPGGLEGCSAGEQSFTTDKLAPTVTVQAATSLGSRTATLNGTVTVNGSAADNTTNFKYGTSPGNYTVTTGSAGTVTTGAFSLGVTGLEPSTTYYYIACATANETGGLEGCSSPSEATFTTNPLTAPTVTVQAATSIGSRTATLNGTVTVNGSATDNNTYFEYGTSSGAPYDTTSATVNTIATGTFALPITGLEPNTTYYYRACATANEAGGLTGCSTETSFTTDPLTAPTVTVQPASAIGTNGATLNGNVTVNGSATNNDTYFKYGINSGGPYDTTTTSAGTVATGSFSKAVAGLDSDIIYYYIACATANETGGLEGCSSGEESFTTVASVSQPTNLWFHNIGSTSMTLFWTEGIGDGSIVVMKQGSAVSDTPVNGTEHIADSVFGSGADLGNSNFVVYRGTGEAVHVTGLTQGLTYHVAIYTYTGAGASIEYLLPGPAIGNETTTANTPHNVAVLNVDDTVGCTSGCHGFHGSAVIPRGAAQETMCTTCHNPAGMPGALDKLNFSLHTNATGFPAAIPGVIDAGVVDCGSCHELHNPSGDDTTFTQHPITDLWANNLYYLRANPQKYVSTALPWPTNNLVVHDPAEWAFEDGAAYEGACQICHTNTTAYDNTPSAGDIHQGGDLGDVNCKGCHDHGGGFAGAGGDCTACHNSIQDKDGAGSNPGRRIVTTEFSGGSIASTHLTGTLDAADCEICHDQSSHQAGQVKLFDPDGGPSIQLSSYGVPTESTGSADAGLLTNFCKGCHDSDGATRYVGNETSPFTTPGTAADVVGTDWATSSHNSPGTTGCFGDGSTGCHSSGHGSQKLTLLAPYDVAPTAPANTEEQEGFCFGCHDSDGPSQYDIESQINSGTNWTAYSTAVSKNPKGEHNQRHDVLWADQDTFGSAIECTSCHLPHKDNSTDANTGVVSHPDDGSKLPDYNPANYTAGELPVLDPANPIGCNPANGTPHVDCETVPGRIESDYIEFCNACHDGGPTYPSGVVMKPLVLNMVTSYETDQHGKGQNNQEGKGTLKPPWVTTLGDDPVAAYAALNCTICHGPHGSVNIYNLRESITVAGVAMEIGGESGSGFDTFSGTTYTLPGTPQEDHKWGAWCTFCHELSGHSSYNEGTTCTDGHKHGDSNF